MESPLVTEWYYADGDNRVGPLAEAQVKSMLANGSLPMETLVWREGMTDWAAAGSVFPAGHTGLTAMACCAECGQTLPLAQMVQLQGLNVCERCKPLAVQKVMEGVTLGTSGGVSAWSDGKLVLTRNGSHLPDRCVKCNAATTAKMKRKLQWHTPWLYLTILVGLLVYFIIALFVRKKAIIHIGVCDRHRQRRMIDIGVMFLGLLGGLALSVFSFSGDRPEFGFFGILVMLAGLVYGAVRTNILTPHRIDAEGKVWLRGACQEYVKSLPPIQ